MLKIWGRLNSINVEKVVWCAGELGLRFERIDAGGKFGVVDTPAFKSLNPCGKVPVIEDDGFVLWESNTIVRYLAGKYALGTLMPEEIASRAEAERWMDFQLASLAPALSPAFRGLVRTESQKRDIDEITGSLKALGDALGIVEECLGDRPYLLGERFTVADIPVGSIAHRWFGLPVGDVSYSRPEFPKLRAWYDRLRERPAIADIMSAPLS